VITYRAGESWSENPGDPHLVPSLTWLRIAPSSTVA
jgi:hypothetical protein